jgi:hypothetical protein
MTKLNSEKEWINEEKSLIGLVADLFLLSHSNCLSLF